MSAMTWMYFGFLMVVVVLTAILVLTGHAEYKDFQWAVALAASSLAGLFQPAPQGPRLPGVGPKGPPATTILLLPLLGLLGACTSSVELHYTPASAPAASALAPIEADQVNLALRPPGQIACPGRACLGASQSTGRLIGVSLDGDAIEIGEAARLRRLPGRPPAPQPGDLYYNVLGGAFEVRGQSAWDAMCLLDTVQTLRNKTLHDSTFTGTLTLPATGATPGSYTAASITVGADGRITAASTGGPYMATSWQITAGTGLTGGGDGTQSRSLALSNTGVTAASYTSPASVTVDAQGRISSITSGGYPLKEYLFQNASFATGTYYAQTLGRHTWSNGSTAIEIPAAAGTWEWEVVATALPGADNVLIVVVEHSTTLGSGYSAIAASQRYIQTGDATQTPIIKSFAVASAGYLRLYYSISSNAPATAGWLWKLRRTS